MYYLNTYKNFFYNVKNIIFCRKIWFIDDVGNKFLDSSSGPMTTNIGYCPEIFINYLLNKLIKLHFSYRFQFLNHDVENLSKKLIYLNKNNKNKCFFLNSGSEASEASIRICIDYFNTRNLLNKTFIIGRYITNHGNTFLSMVYGDDSSRKNVFSKKNINPEFFNIKIIQCYCFNCPLLLFPKTCKLECIKKSIKIIVLFGIDKISSLILEPITAASAGTLIPHINYFKYLKYKLKKINILLISDEIVNSFLRIGNWFVNKIDSDISIIGKGLGSGFYPISGVILADFITKVISINSPTYSVGHTYSSNSFSASISLIILAYLEQIIHIDDIITKSRYLHIIILFMFRNISFLSNFRIKGLLCSLETTLTKDIVNMMIYFNNIIGIYLYVCRSSGRNRNSFTILISPQFNICEYYLFNFLFNIKNIINFIFF